ncbi:hypothetical protein Ddye_026044 [Dipteronia dyeriana]|uniref:Uncharacterized protein n=1 Tax=Dipteronia dyeriana TaxID=168575 RepID=A0AAD9WNS3_9ROSI|nr:hypothetical protein Ddye_026044 [Dipteronia dyeriana]
MIKNQATSSWFTSLVAPVTPWSTSLGPKQFCVIDLLHLPLVHLELGLSSTIQLLEGIDLVAHGHIEFEGLLGTQHMFVSL